MMLHLINRFVNYLSFDLLIILLTLSLSLSLLQVVAADQPRSVPLSAAGPGPGGW